MDTNAATTDETPTPDTLETPALQATGDTTTETPVVATDSTDGDDDAEVKAESDDGKIDAVKVNEIVKGRLERARVKIRKEAEDKAADEIAFWKEKAKEQKLNTAIIQIPPKPELKDYASNPTQYEKDIATWSEIKSNAEGYFRSIAQAYQTRSIEFAKDKPDFDKSCQVFLSLTVAPTLEQTILESEHGPAVAYYLSKNLREFERINKLSANSIARELGKLELKLAGQLKEVVPVDTKKPVVPKPTAPVSGQAPQSTNPATLVKTEAGRQQFLKDRKAVHLKGVVRR